MSLDSLIDQLPSYAKDLKLNFSSLVRQQTELTPQQLWGTVVASAMASRNPELTQASLEAATQHLPPEIMESAKAAAAIMGMNNIYYRFTHLVANEKYRTIPARLRMNVMRTQTAGLDFELWCTAVSAINGCGACLDSHEHVLREKGVAEEVITAAIRIAAVLHAIATVLDAEEAASSASA
jgi:alkyl hydroperoxide reductase subunit D